MAGHRTFRVLTSASSPASKVQKKNNNAHIIQQIHIRWQQYTQDNYNNTQANQQQLHTRQLKTSNKYMRDKLEYNMYRR